MQCLLVVQGGGGEHHQLCFVRLFVARHFFVRFQVFIVIICGCSTYWDVAGVVGLLPGRMANLGLGES